MRRARREVPKIAGVHVPDLGPTLFVEGRDPACAVEHDGPLGLLVPMQLADAVLGEPHVHAGDVFRDCEVGLRDFARPTAVLVTLVRVVERCPELGHAIDVGGRRILERWELARQRRILRTWVVQARRVLCVDPALRWTVRVAKRRRFRGSGNTESGCRSRRVREELAPK